MKDWTGNSKSVHSVLGASNHSLKEREANDYYATEPKAAELLLQVEDFAPNIWECACGECHLSKVFEVHGYNVKSTDLIYRDGGMSETFDFLVESKPNSQFMYRAQDFCVPKMENLIKCEQMVVVL